MRIFSTRIDEYKTIIIYFENINFWTVWKKNIINKNKLELLLTNIYKLLRSHLLK